MRHAIALVLLVAGVAVLVLSCLGVLLVPGAYEKLHFAAPASSLGGLLVGVALAVEVATFTPAVKYLFTGGRPGGDRSRRHDRHRPRRSRA